VGVEMGIFFTLLEKIAPLYIVILLGYLAGKLLHVKKESIAPLLIYVIAPFVIFNGVTRAQIGLGTLSLPVLFFILACLMCGVFYVLSSYIWKSSEKNIVAFTSGTGNTGYFGLPVAIAIFGSEIVPLIVLSVLGFVLFENTLGFYITARGNFTPKESFLKVLRLPTMYAFLAGLFVNLNGINLGKPYLDLATNFQGAYSTLGMMLIGLGIASIAKFEFDYKFITITFFAKFIAWSLIMAGVIFLDITYFHVYSVQIHQVMILMSVVPLAANTVALATELRTHPEKASMAVLLSTLFALFYIPLVVMLFKIG
jgi:malate permease and related proteins